MNAGNPMRGYHELKTPDKGVAVAIMANTDTNLDARVWDEINEVSYMAFTFSAVESALEDVFNGEDSSITQDFLTQMRAFGKGIIELISVADFNGGFQMLREVE